MQGDRSGGVDLVNFGIAEGRVRTGDVLVELEIEDEEGEI